MTSLPPESRPTLTPAVKALLDELRRRLRRYVWIDGIAASVAWLGVAFWITLAADWFFEPTPLVRKIMLAVVAVVFAAIVVRLIVRRAFARVTDANAAMIYERRFPELNDSLLTAVVLGGRELETADVSRPMFDRTCGEAASRVDAIDPRKVFNPKPLRLHGIAAGLLTTSMVLFALLYPEAIGVWARRALAMSNEPWPRRTKLTVEGFPDGIRKVARGSDVEVVALADTSMPRVPASVEVRYRIAGGGRGRGTMDRRGVARPTDPFQEYAYTFRGVLSDVRFDVVGGDARVRGLRIKAVESPIVSLMTLHCQLPEYIGRRQPPLPISGVMQIPMGSHLTVRAGDANKELVSVEVGGLIDDRALPAQILDPGNMAADHRGFFYSLGPLMKDTTLLFTLKDTDGIKSREPVRVALVPVADQPPQLSVQLDGIGTAVTPQARIPVLGQITDDYGIARVWFEEAVDDREPSTRPIAQMDLPTAAYNLTDAALEIRDLGLKPGQKLFVTVKAEDFCDLEGQPNVAAGERWLLDVVTPEQLRAMLEARELVLRQRFEQMIQEMTETRDLLARMKYNKPSSTSPKDKNPNKLDDDAYSPERERDMHLLRVEGALTNCRKGGPEVAGLSEAFLDICKQLVNNRIDTQELISRLRGGIAEPLGAMAAEMFPELERRLDDLKGVLEDPVRGPAARDDARAEADEILLLMRKILDRMIELEDFNEVLDMLRTIVDSQNQLHDRTQKYHKKKIRDLLKSPSKQDKGKQDQGKELGQDQRQLAEKYKHLEDVLLRMAEMSAATDPRRAALLRKAIAQSKEQLIGLSFDRAADLLDKGRLSRALENQKQLDRDLRSLLELLEKENRRKSLANEKARIREYLKQLGSIIKRQKDIQGRTTGGDDAKRLADEQSKLGGKTGRLAEKIKKNEEKSAGGQGKGQGQGEGEGSQGKGGGQGQGQGEGGGGKAEGGKKDSAQEQDQNPARKRLDAARQRMREAEKKLKEAKRKGAAKDQEEAIAALEKAKAELEEILRQLREEEIGRTLAMLEARFRKMLQMEEAIHEGTVRLDKVPRDQRTHNHEIEASRLSGRQSRIVVEVDKALLLLREDGSAVAFVEAIDLLREDMQILVERLAQAKVGKLTQSIEEDVLAALKEMIDAFKKAQKDLEDQESQSQGGGGQPGDKPLVDTLAELRMIRALQMRVNTRTKRYSRLIDGEQADSAELIEALQKLAERQQRIHRVTRDIEMGRNQ